MSRMVNELSPAGVPMQDIDALSAIYEDAAAKLRQIVLHPPGSSDTARKYNAARAASQLRQVDDLISSLKFHAAKWVGTFTPVAFADGIRRANQQAKEAGVRPENSAVEGAFDLIDHRAVAVFARDMVHDLNKAADSMGTRSKAVLRQTRQMGLSEGQINQVLAGGVLTGHPVQAIRQLREQLRAVHGNTVRIIDKNGDPIDFKVGYYAKLVSVTRTREAQQAARHERLESVGLDLVSIVGRISKNFCTAYLGKVFSISGKSTEYPPLASTQNGGPPFHVQCSKSTRPFVEALASKKQRELAGGWDGSDLMLGVDASKAQRIFKDQQIYTQVRDGYATTAEKLFGKAA